MNSSVKFLSPIVIAGFLAPGFDAAAGAAPVDAPVLLLLLLLLPQAATASASPATSTASMSLLIESTPCRVCGRSLLRSSNLHAHRPLHELRVAGEAQSSRGDRALHQREHPLRGERQRGDQDRAREHTRQPVVGL